MNILLVHIYDSLEAWKKQQENRFKLTSLLFDLTEDAKERVLHSVTVKCMFAI